MGFNFNRKINLMPYMIDEGYVENITSVLKFGTNPDVDNNNEEDVWSVGGTLQPLSSAENLTISSSEPFTVIVTGVDENYDLTTEVVVLDGVSTTDTVNTFLGVITAQISPDSPSVNTSDITGTASVSGTVQFQILADYGQTEMSHFIVPAGYTAFMINATVSSSRNDNARVRFQQAVDGTTYITKASFETNEAPTHFDFESFPLGFEERSRFRVRAKATTNNTSVTAVYQLLLVKNEFLEG